MIKYGFFNKQSGPLTSRFSLKVSESDYAENETVLNTLIGTLVKYNQSGRLEPYLAKEFNVSGNGLIWTFNLHENLSCQDGTPINGLSYKKSLTKQLELYSKSGSPLDFSLLEGWSTFLKNPSIGISGIVADKQSIKFIFLKKPMDFLEILRMPYFGFWRSISDLDNALENFVSSGAYQIDISRSNDRLITLKKRDKWFSLSDRSSQYIEFKFVSEEDLVKHDFTILEILRPRPPQLGQNYQQVQGSPTMMYSFVLSPIKNGPFKEKENRLAFASRFKKLQETSLVLVSQFFYPSARSVVNTQDNVEYTDSIKKSTLHFAFNRDSFAPEISEEVVRLTQLALKDTNSTIIFKLDKETNSNWRQLLLENEEYDVRFDGVDIGGHIQNMVIKMIFCSKLGVNYPDPSSRICNLVKKQDDQGGNINQTYIDKFNQILADDAVVIPLMHYGTTWYLSENIDPKTFPPTVVSPLFESIYFK